MPSKNTRRTRWAVSWKGLTTSCLHLWISIIVFKSIAPLASYDVRGASPDRKLSREGYKSLKEIFSRTKRGLTHLQVYPAAIEDPVPKDLEGSFFLHIWGSQAYLFFLFTTSVLGLPKWFLTFAKRLPISITLSLCHSQTSLCMNFLCYCPSNKALL